MVLTAPGSTLIAASVASALAALVAYITLVINKENKISEFRQEWIDALRDDVAKFLAGSRALVRSVENKRYIAAHPDKLLVSDYSPELMGTVRTSSAEALSRIKLRLNLKKEEHCELERLLDSSVATLNRWIDSPNASSIEAFASIDRAMTQARTLLKTEWERVKAGETAYVNAKTAMKSILLVAVIAAAAVAFVVVRELAAG